MVATLALLTLLIARAPAAAAPSPAAQSATTQAAATHPAAAPPAAAPCEVFARDSATAPPQVRAWFAASSDVRVLVCRQSHPPGAAGAGAPLYYGHGSITRHGMVCSFVSHGLTPTVTAGATRLRRDEHSEAVAMALADEHCPAPPHGSAAANAYILTYGTSRAAFVAIMQLWLELTAPGPPHGGPDLNLLCCSLASAKRGGAEASPAALESLRRLQTAIADQRLQKAGITRVVRIPGSILRHRYAVFVKDSGKPPVESGLYVIYVQRTLHGYEVSDFAVTN